MAVPTPIGLDAGAENISASSSHASLSGPRPEREADIAELTERLWRDELVPDYENPEGIPHSDRMDSVD